MGKCNARMFEYCNEENGSSPYSLGVSKIVNNHFKTNSTSTVRINTPKKCLKQSKKFILNV